MSYDADMHRIPVQTAEQAASEAAQPSVPQEPIQTEPVRDGTVLSGDMCDMPGVDTNIASFGNSDRVLGTKPTEEQEIDLKTRLKRSGDHPGEF